MNSRINNNNFIYQAVLITTGLSLVFVLLYYLCIRWDYFGAKSVNVKGCSYLSADDIMAYGNLEKGVNILCLNLFLVRKKLLSHPWIEDVKVKRLFPPGLEIEVKEHRPIAVFNIGSKFLADESGKFFKVWTENDPHMLPVVKGLRFSDIPFGDKLRTNPFNAVMNVLQSLREPDNGISEHMVSEILVDPELGLTLVTRQERDFFHIKRIKMGYHNYGEKFRKLKIILGYLKDHENDLKIETIDLSNPARIIVSPINYRTFVTDTD